MKLLFAGSTSACLELSGSTPYFAASAYTVYLAGTEICRGDTNVFSLYDLSPDTEYLAEAVFEDGSRESLAFCTAKETCAVSVLDFGAVGDGIKDNTQAIQTAIDLLPPGGRLVFPAGIYLTFPISLKSHTTLEFKEGATLLGSTDRAGYPVVPAFTLDPVTGKEVQFAGFEGLERSSYKSLLHAAYAEDIRIIGPGTVDGNAQNGDWWQEFKNFPDARPRVFFCTRCKNITLHGITAQNSASWQLHPYFSEDIDVLDVKVRAPKISPNTDAIDPESCDRVNIIGCRLSVGDDCIAIKAGKIDLAKKYHTPADHHTVRNCLMEFGHGAVTLGSELSAGIKNLTVSQCYFIGTDRGLRIKSRRGRGRESLITNVTFDNIRMESVLTPIVINAWYNCVDPDAHSEYVYSREPHPVDERTPRFGSFAFRNMVCTGTEVAACYIDGLTESPIEEVELENISVAFAEDAKPGKPAMWEFARPVAKMGLYLDNVKKIRLQNVTLDGVVGEKLIADHYEDIEGEPS